MKRFYLASISAGFALALMGSPLAMAQDYQHNDYGSGHNEMQHGNQPNARMENHDGPMNNGSDHYGMQHGNQPTAYQDHGAPMNNGSEHYGMQHGAAPEQYHAEASRQWRNGDHYTGGRTVVRNWSHYHLRQPPYGYEWVQDNNQMVMIAIASGVIASVIAAQ